MRTVECNFCGEPLAAATDDELMRRLHAHVQERHPSAEWDEDKARATIAQDAYEATDN